MLVQLKRNWFAPNGMLYETRNGLAEVPDDFKDVLPKDAIVISAKGGLPFDTGKPKLPGFGAKPAHELVLDEVMGAAPTHQITTAAGEGQQPAPDEKLKKATEKEVAGQVKRAEEKAKLVEEKKLDL